MCLFRSVLDILSECQKVVSNPLKLAYTINNILKVAGYSLFRQKRWNEEYLVNSDLVMINYMRNITIFLQTVKEMFIKLQDKREKLIYFGFSSISEIWFSFPMMKYLQ